MRKGKREEEKEGRREGKKRGVRKLEGVVLRRKGER